ncbi:MAG: flippase-like domain-containing protein, partial [Clostridia bacterium]|nr:flippase-like domain-containing protein [Clostridia bacterium]
SSNGWIFISFLCMFGFIYFEGAAILSICKELGYKKNRRQGIVYSAADIYFSAITPSATGGQPASAYFMIKDGIPALAVTAALHFNLLLYTLSIIIIGIVEFILFYNVFLNFGPLSKFLIVFGFIIQIILMTVFVVLFKKTVVIKKIGFKVISILSKLHLIKNKEQKYNKLGEITDSYSQYSEIVKKHPKIIFKALAFNLLQRISVIAVPLFVYLATGGRIIDAKNIFAIQSFAVIGSNTIPIPGAMGVMDYIMLDGYSKVISYGNTVNFELVSRALSFYICMFLCGIITLLKYLSMKKR